ncbi:MAG: PH domain-containing protein [Oscillospiraceae bacterium]
MKHQHPLKILFYSSKNLWLLIFPLIRGLLSISFGDVVALYDWFSGAWFDLLIVFIILFIGYVRWQFSCFKISDDCIVFLNGVFIKTRKIIPLKNISSITEERTFYLRPFKATKLLVNTRAGTLDKDLLLLVNDKDLSTLRRSFKSDFQSYSEKNQFDYKPKFWHTLFFSFVFSSTLSGAIYIFVFFFHTGDVLEQFLQHSVIDEFNTVTENVSKILMLNVSPIFVSISLLIAFSWLMSFIRNVLRYTKFRIRKNSFGVFINTGIFTKRNYKIVSERVNYLDLKQNFITKIFKFTSINVDCSGYGYKKDEIPVFIPIMSRKNSQKTISALMPTMKIYPNNYKPRWTNLWRYTYKAVLLIVGFFILYFILNYFFPNAKSIIDFIIIMAEIPSVWYLIISVISLFTTGFSLVDNQLCIRYSRGFSFHTILVSDIKLAKISVTQTIFQKFSETYNISFYITTEKKQKHKVMGISKSAIKSIVSNV